MDPQLASSLNLPPALLSYLTTCPLPTLIVSSPSSTSPFISQFQSFSFRQLTNNLSLQAVLSTSSWNGLQTWLSSPYPSAGESPGSSSSSSMSTGSSSGGSGRMTYTEDETGTTLDPSALDGDLELQLRLGSLKESTERLLTTVWRRSLVLSDTESSVLEGGGIVGEGRTFILQCLLFPPKRLSRISKTALLDSQIRPVTAVDLDKEEKSEERASRIHAEEEERSRELELIFDRSSVGLARLDLEGRLTYFSASWIHLTSHPSDRPKEEWSRCLIEEDYEKLVTVWKEARINLGRKEGDGSFGGRFRLKNGRIVLACCTPNNADLELVTGWVANMTDVTDQVASETALQEVALEKERATAALELEKERASREMERASREEERRRDAEEGRRGQELLIDVTSHEIRNPISAILQNSDLTRSSLVHLIRLFAQLKSEGKLPLELIKKESELREDLEAVESVTECARAQERIANDILGLAQIGAKRYSLTPVPFRLYPSVRTILRMFSTECRAKDIVLELVIGEGLKDLGEDVVLEADPVRLGQVWTNLVSNAVRFTALAPVRRVSLVVDLSAEPPPGENDPLIPPPLDPSTLPIHLSSTNRPLCFYFAVNDTGPGMTQDETKHVFERFMQASATTHITMGGSGLGLWIARSLCELHGGRIEVVSTPNVGSSFRGFVQAKLSSISDVVTPISPSFNSPTIPNASFSLKILVADDNQVNRTILVRQLSGVGHKVFTARDGKEAVEMIERAVGEGDAFDCCLMDVEMPVLDGLSATRLLRETEQQTGRRKLRVVGCTGNARDAQVRAALDSGMDDLVTKPYRIAHLLQTLVA